MNKIFLIALFLVVFNGYNYANEFSQYSNEQIVNAIFKAEGEYKAVYLYGIKNIKYKNEREARQICLNSVRNGRTRWIKAGKPYDLIIFIGLKYCPPKAHPLNSNWVRNVKYILQKGDK